MASVASSTEPTTVTTTATTTASEGPVLTVLTKRIRALRKKHNRILQMEQSLSQGKQLNPEQLEVVRSKPALLTLIDELEKLRAPISAALDEELSLERNNVVEDMVDLMYFGSLFDVKQQSEFTSLLTKTHERECCLTYDCVTDDDAVDVDLLGEKDLDLISEVLGLMNAKPVNSTLSHRNAVEKCLKHAKLWTAKSNQPVLPQSDVTYAMLREKLNKIMSSGYYTATPQMKGPVEVAAAAAVANFPVPIHESVVNVQVPIIVEGSHEQYQVEGSTEQYQETQENAANYEVQSQQENASNYEVQSHQENAANYEEPEITERHQSVDSEEFRKDEKEPGNPPEDVSVQTDQEQYQNEEGEHGYQNVNYKGQQYAPRGGRRGGGRGGGGGRRGYYNGRGGGRGTGRGNGSYQNGRNQYHDNSYPRNYNNRRGRGGPAGSGGNSNGNGNGGYYNNSSGTQGNHPRGDIGVAS